MLLGLFVGFALGGFCGVCIACLAVSAGRKAPEPTHHALDDDGGG